MLRAAQAQLLASPNRDISTRAVCDAVGVGAPVLYRLFGDKDGLLSAVVDQAFQRNLASKRVQPLSAIRSPTFIRLGTLTFRSH